MNKKILGILFAVLFVASAAYAGVKILDDDTNVGQVEQINVKGAVTTRSGNNGVIDLRIPTITDVSNINFSALSNDIQTAGINWTSVQAAQVGVTGINWTFFSPSNAGVNWTAASNNASATNIVCWKTNGQLGKCGTSVSGVNCTACN